MELTTVLELITEFGLPLILLIGAIYVLYRFMVFSLYEVKKDFGKRHEDHARAMQEVKISLARIESDIKTLLELYKDLN